MRSRLFPFILLCATACSPYSFQKEVSTFSGSVDELSDAVVTGYSNLQDDRAAEADLQLIRARAMLNVAPECAVPASTPTDFCGVFARRGRPPELFGSADEQKARAEALAVLPALKDYAHALAAVTNAQDRAAYDAAVSQLSDAVGNITAAANAAAPGAGIVAPAAINFAGWLVGTALDQQRFDSLKHAVHAVQQPIHSVATTLGAGLELINDQRRRIIKGDIDASATPMAPSLSEADYRQQLTDLEAKLAVLNALRRSEPATAAESMAQAHEALIKAVDDPQRNYGSLVKALNDFSQKVGALRDALATAAKLGKSQKGT